MRRFCNCSRRSKYKTERDSESLEEKTITSSNPDCEPEQFMQQIHRINMLETLSWLLLAVSRGSTDKINTYDE
jgi:hypothetical protein